MLGKKEKEEKVLKQDLTQKDENNGVFVIHLFMKEKCDMPDKEYMTHILQKHMGEVECFSHNEKSAGFAVKKYKVEFKEGKIPPQLLITEAFSTENYQLDALTVSQMWDCPNARQILNECKYHVVAVDMMASLLPYKDRADMLMDDMEALVELYPQCQAVQFQSSGKMFPREKVANHSIPREDRFIYFAVNARFFNIQGTNDHIVDTLGMTVMGLPDLQYHFHDFDPNHVVNHAYNTASYIFSGNSVIESGDNIDGIKDGKIDRSVQWKCQYENSLIQPLRPVIDICMNEYASGKRE